MISTTLTPIWHVTEWNGTCLHCERELKIMLRAQPGAKF